jgi:hypothetical protein
MAGPGAARPDSPGGGCRMILAPQTSYRETSKDGSFGLPRTPQVRLEPGMRKCYTSSRCEMRSNPRPRGWIRPRGRGREPFRTIDFTSHSVAAWHEPGSTSLSSATDRCLPRGWIASLTENRAGCWGIGKRPGADCAGHCAPAGRDEDTDWRHTHHGLQRISTTLDLQAWRHGVCSRFLSIRDGLCHTPTAV